MIYTSSNQNLTARILVARDWKDLRDIRLEAIRVERKYFFYKARTDRKINNHQWKALCNKSNNQCMFGLFDGIKIIGISLIRKHNKDLLFGGSYIRKSYRGNKQAKYVYDARMKWLNDNPYHKHAFVFHRAGNLQSRALNRKRGEPIKPAIMMKWADGKFAYGHWYRLKQSRKIKNN